MEGKAVKFGGTSLCDASHLEKVANIVRSDPLRRVVVVSAPGKRYPEDEKITDLLIRADRAPQKEKEAIFSLVENRFDEMIHTLSLPLDLGLEYKNMRTLKGDALISRGEYFSARILSVLLGATFLDAAGCIFFRADGTLNETKTRAILGEKLSKTERAVIPGFYGVAPDGKIKLFSRGGSDITGAIAADAMDAEIYENFTDVPGFLLTDPAYVPEAQTVPTVSYRELRYLSAKGAQVLHADAILPLRKKQIPIMICNTRHPEGACTKVTARKAKGLGGIIPSTGYTMVALERPHIGGDSHALSELLTILDDCGFAPSLVSHEPDALHALIRFCDYTTADRIAARIQKEMDAELVTVRGSLAEIAIAGEGFSAEIRAALWMALKKADIRPLFAAGVTEGFSMVLGVSETELRRAVGAIYEELKGYI